MGLSKSPQLLEKYQQPEKEKPKQREEEKVILEGRTKLKESETWRGYVP